MGGVGLIGASELHTLGPDATSSPFGHGASGNAASVLLIKPLEDAIRDENVIRAIIRGTGSSYDEHIPGVTVLKPNAQVELIRSIYQNAGLSFDDTGLFEAYGHGKFGSDQVESSGIGAAISATFGQSRSNGMPPLDGSIITSSGPASGLAAIIKAVYSLEKGLIIRNVRRGTLTLQSDMPAWKLETPVAFSPWPTESLRRISIAR